jgi:hypothetical protein
MEKKDWRQSVRQERTTRAATTGNEGTPRTGSRSSSYGFYSLMPGVDGWVSTGDTKANAYAPETDEMRCLLWVHGGQFHLAMQVASSGHHFALIYRRLLFRERRSGKVRGDLQAKINIHYL